MCEYQIFERLMAFLLIVVGVHMMWFDDAVQVSHMRIVLQTVGSDAFGFGCFIVGCFRVTVLAGMSPVAKNYSNFRMVGAGAAAIIWLLMVSSFAQRLVLTGSPIPPGFYMLAAQFVGEVWMIFLIATRRA